MPELSESGKEAVLRSLLREYRRSKGLTQTGLATLLNKPQSYVSKYESGERRLSVLELRGVCHSLGVTLPRFATDLEDLLEQARES